MAKVYRSFDDFKREELASGSRIGFSIDELEIDECFQEFLFDDTESDDESDDE